MANIELDGANKKIKVDSGDLTLDVPGDIILDADGGDITFADGGTNLLKITNSSSDVVFQPQVDAKDIIFKQYDGTNLLEINDGGYVAIANGATGPGQLRLYEDTDNGTNYSAFQVGTQSGDITYTLPTADGSNGHALTTNGSGTLSWASAGTTYAGIDDQSSSNDDQITISDTAVIINEDSDDLDFRVESNGNTHMLFVDGGNDKVGIGESGAAPLGTLHVYAGNSTATSVQSNSTALVVEGAANAGIQLLSTNDEYNTINFGDPQDPNIGGIQYYHTNNDMTFTCNTGTAFKITDGTAKFFTTTDFGGTRCHIKGSFYANRGLGLNSSDGASSGGQVNMVYFGVENSAQGSITAGAGSVVYNTSSDYRRKENVSNLTGAIDRVKQFKPYRFNFTDDPSKKVRDGFFAHEVTSIVPESVTGEKDAVEKYRDGQDIPEGKSVGDNILDGSGNTIPDYQGIDHSKLVPLLTAALKEAITKIETLETKVKALEEA